VAGAIAQRNGGPLGETQVSNTKKKGTKIQWGYTTHGLTKVKKKGGIPLVSLTHFLVNSEEKSTVKEKEPRVTKRTKDNSQEDKPDPASRSRPRNVPRDVNRPIFPT